jgi:pimeloyl-ACP methyl ester carboxylesterase
MDAGRLKRQGRLQEDLRIPGSEGTQIAVWVLSPRGKAATRGTVVLLHPLETSKMWLFSHAETLAERGWYVVLLDLPGHGMSDGAYITWGVKEKYDVSVAVDALLAGGKIRHPLFAAGTSFGGMVALQYAALDSRCRGVLAISAPIDCPTVARRILIMVPESDYRAALVRAGLIANFDPQEASSLKAAAKMKCPMILIHGRLDAIVPYDWSEKILAAHRGPKRLITLPFDGHTPEVMRERWLSDRIEELAAMASPDQTAPPASPR